MNDLNNGQTQGVLSDMLQHLQEATPDSDTAFTLREEVDEQSPNSTPVDGDVIELGGEFDYEGYQVVRREFFAHTNEPSITFNNFKVYVNAACLSRFPSVDYVQVLVNSDSKILAIRPCREEERDAFSWCVPGSTRRKPRQITCRLFFVKVFSLMLVAYNRKCKYPLVWNKLYEKNLGTSDALDVDVDLPDDEVDEAETVEE